VPIVSLSSVLGLAPKGYLERAKQIPVVLVSGGFALGNVVAGAFQCHSAAILLPRARHSESHEQIIGFRRVSCSSLHPLALGIHIYLYLWFVAVVSTLARGLGQLQG
jgi:hypothetical protein